MNTIKGPLTCALLGMASACGSTNEISTDAGSSASAIVANADAAEAAAPQTDSEVDSGVFADPEHVFAMAKQTLLSGYYTDTLTEGDLYRAALRGMLEYADPKMSKWNKLLTPAEVAELRIDLKGEVVGIGVIIKFDEETGRLQVLGDVANSPAEHAGVLRGDIILSVDGKRYKGKHLRDAVGDIRGPAGTQVSLSILRDDTVQTFVITRASVPFDPVHSMQLSGGVGYVAIRSFSAKTAPLVHAALDGFHDPHGLIVDLRNCPGGSFDDAIATADLLLASGTPIVKLQKRGGQSEMRVSKGPGFAQNVPTLVLVDNATSSGCEFVTAALRDGRGARVVGSHTFGKWSVQQIADLPNGYALKYTIALFTTPSGKTYDGVGLSPDVDVTTDDKGFDHVDSMNDPQARVAADGPLRTALALLKR